MWRRVKESVNNRSRPHFVLLASITSLTSSALAGRTTKPIAWSGLAWPGHFWYLVSRLVKCRSARGGIRWTSDKTQATAAVPVVGHSEIFITLMSLMCSEYLIRRLSVHFWNGKASIIANERPTDQTIERASGRSEWVSAAWWWKWKC